MDRLDRATARYERARTVRMRYTLAQSLVRMYSRKLGPSDRDGGSAKRDGGSAQRAAEAKELACMRRMYAERSRLLESEAPSHSAVVVFRRAQSATLCAQVQLSSTLQFWHTEHAPGPQDAVWRNMALTKGARAWKTLRGRVVAIAMIVYFMVPISYLRRAEKEFVDTFGDKTAGVVQGAFVLVLTIIFFIVGHMLSLALSRRMGHVSFSEMDVEGASIYFYLLVVNGVLANLDDANIWEDLGEYSLDMEEAGRELARRFAAASPFFLAFVLLRTAQSVPLELIHPPFHLGFVSKWVAHKVKGTTGLSEKQLREWTLPEATPIHRVPAQAMLIFFLGTVYAVVSPLLLIVCTIFFACFTVVWRHNVVYHYRQRYVAGGNLWPWLVKNMTLSLVFAQVVCIFSTGSWGGGAQRLALVPLPLLTIWVYVVGLLPALSKASVRPLDTTLDKERAKKMLELEEEVNRSRWYDYCPHNLKPTPTELSAASIVRRWWRRYAKLVRHGAWKMKRTSSKISSTLQTMGFMSKSGKLSFTHSEGRIDEGAEAEENATYGPSQQTPSEASDNSDLATAATGAEPGDATSAPVSPPPVAPPPSISPMSGFDLHRDATLL